MARSYNKDKTKRDYEDVNSGFKTINQLPDSSKGDLYQYLIDTGQKDINKFNPSVVKQYGLSSHEKISLQNTDPYAQLIADLDTALQAPQPEVSTSTLRDKDTLSMSSYLDYLNTIRTPQVQPQQEKMYGGYPMSKNFISGGEIDKGSLIQPTSYPMQEAMIQKNIAPEPSELKKLGSSLGQTMAGMNVGTLNLLREAGQLVPRAAAGIESLVTGKDVSPYQGPVYKGLTDLIKTQEGVQERLGETTSQLEGGEKYIYGALGQLPQLPYLLTGNEIATLGALGGQAGGGKMRELEQEQIARGQNPNSALNFLNRLGGGVLSGSVEVATEKGPLETLYDVVKKVTPTKVAKEMVEEFLGEGISGIVDPYINNLSLGEKTDIDIERDMANFIEQGVSGALASVLFVGVGAGVQSAQNALKNPTPQNINQALEDTKQFIATDQTRKTEVTPTAEIDTTTPTGEEVVNKELTDLESYMEELNQSKFVEEFKQRHPDEQSQTMFQDIMDRYKNELQQAIETTPKSTVTDVEQVKPVQSIQEAEKIPTEADKKAVEPFIEETTTEEPKTYRYMTTQRPPGPGAVPRGAVNVESFDDKTDGAWGYVEYSKPLTQEQIDDYELTPSEVSTEVSTVVEKPAETVQGEVVDELMNVITEPVVDQQQEIEAKQYPLADKGEWWGDADYEQRGGNLVYMSPDDFLKNAKPLEMDEDTQENVQELIDHIESGRTLDPLALYSLDKTDVKASDGRHRALAAKELGIKEVPVLDFTEKATTKALPTEIIPEVYITGQKATADVYRGTGKTKGKEYTSFPYPVIGEGTYYAMTEDQAELYGDNIEKKSVNLNNPYVINDDSDFKAITEKAGWNDSNLSGMDKDESIKLINNLKDMLVNDGYDGVIIQYEDAVSGDKNRNTGNSVKSIRNMFGHDQIVSYGKPKQVVTEQEKTSIKRNKKATDLFTDLEQGTASRSGDTIFSFKLNDKLPKSEWTKLNNKIKDMGGYYSQGSFKFVTDSLNDAIDMQNQLAETELVTEKTNSIAEKVVETKPSKKKLDYKGFTDNKTTSQQKRVESVLSKKQSYNGTEMTRKDFIESSVKDGSFPDIIDGKSVIVSKDGNTVSVTKTEAAYAEYLIDKSEVPIKVEQKEAVEKQYQDTDNVSDQIKQISDDEIADQVTKQLIDSELTKDEALAKIQDVIDTQINDNTVVKEDEHIKTVTKTTKGVSKTTTTIDDFGEKIGGAKKDLWATKSMDIEDLLSMNEREMESLVTKAKVFKAINYEQLVEDGVPAEVAYFVKKVKDSLPSKPRKLKAGTTVDQYRKDRAMFIGVLEEAKEALSEVKTEDDAYSFFKNFTSTYNYGRGAYPITLLAKATDNPYFTNKFIKAMQISKWKLDSYRKTVRDTGWPAKQEAWRKGISIKYSDYNEYKWHINKKLGKYNYQTLAKGFDSREEAEQYLTEELKSEITKKRQNKKPEIPQLSHIDRSGEDYRNGENVEEQDFIDVFGFKGGEFGNWVNQTERQVYMNHAYDALMDLSKLLGVNPKALTFEGQLSLAFGARGRGNALAHYEPDRKIINLTKMKGAGSLAHEWFHAFDDYLGQLSGDRPASKPLATEGVTNQSKLSNNMQQAVKNFVDSMKYTFKTTEEMITETKGDIARYDKRIERALDPIVTSMKKEVTMYDGKKIRGATAKESAAIDRIVDDILHTEDRNQVNKLIEELSGMKKSIKGRVISKDIRNEISGLLQWKLSKVERLKDIKNGNIPQAKKESSYSQESSKIGNASYWASNVEMAARAFGSFVEDVLPGKSQYLVHSHKNGLYNQYKPYPDGIERINIERAIANLIDTAKEEGILESVDKGLYRDKVNSLANKAQREVEKAIMYNLELPESGFAFDEVIRDIKTRGFESEFKEELQEMLSVAKKITKLPRDKEIKASFRELKKLVTKTQKKVDAMVTKEIKLRDRFTNKIQATKETEQQKALIKLENAKVRHETKLSKERDKLKSKIQAVKETEQQKALIQKEKTKETVARKKERQADSAERTQLISTLKELSRTKKKMYPHFQEAAQEILDVFDYKAKSISPKNKVRLENTRAYFDSLLDEDPSFVINPDIQAKLDRLNKVQIKDMTIDEVRALQDIASNIIHLNKFKKKLLANKKSKEIGKVLESVAYDIRSDIPDTLKERNIRDLLKQVMVNDVMPPWIISKWYLSGGKDTNTFYQVVQTPLEAGERKKIEYKKMAHEYLQNALDRSGLTAKELTGRKAERQTFKLSNGAMVKLNPAEKISVYFHSKNADNVRHLTEGGGRTVGRNNKMPRAVKFTESDLTKIANSLTDQERKFANIMFDFFQNEQKDAINETSLTLDGYLKATVDNYYGIVTDSMYRNKAFNPFLLQASVENQRWLKDRGQGKSPIIIEDFLSVLERSTEEVGSYYGLAVPLRDAKMIMGNSRITKALNDANMQPVQKYWANLFKDLEGSYSDRMAIETLSMMMVRNTQKALLGLNAWVNLYQPASLFTASYMIDGKYLAKAVVKKNDFAKMEKYSSIIWYRRQGYVTREAGDIAKQKSEFHKATDIFTAPIQKFDSMAIGKIWNAVELETQDTTDLKVGSDEYYEKVARRTEQIIYKTQPNYTTMQRPTVSRSDSAFVKIATAFMTQRLQNYAIMYDGVMETKNNKNKKILAKSASAVISTQLVIAILQTMRGVWRGYEDDELEALTENFITSMLSNIPYVGELIGSAMTGWEVERLDTSMLNDIVKAMTYLAKRPKSMTPLGAVKEISGVASTLFGIPFENARRTMEAMMKNLSPEAFYYYQKTFTVPTNTKVYEASWEAVKAHDDDFLDTLVKDMKKLGIKSNNFEQSMKSRWTKERDEWVASQEKDLSDFDIKVLRLKYEKLHPYPTIFINQIKKKLERK